MKLYFVRDIVARGSVRIEKVAIEQNPLDMLTKSLLGSKFHYCLDMIRLVKG